MKNTILILFAVVAFMPFVFAEEEKISPKDLYGKGIIALNQGDCPKAMKYLFAFKMVKYQEINQYPQFLQKIEASVLYCETKVSQVYRP